MKTSRTSVWLILLLVLGAGAALGGCGQKGDLYLPDKPQELRGIR